MITEIVLRMIKIGAIIVKFSEKTSMICRDLTNIYHDSIKISRVTTKICRVMTKIYQIIIKLHRDLIFSQVFADKNSQIANKTWLMLIMIHDEMSAFSGR